ncbi:hypothetical protein SERLA73DRAFT_115336 [Serpula lacrymans var. lacrymans S7.3]|uniref:VWFA domain-containing protein n=1 Tax=Serpula lacrymans var. lacrymans (strain S7.3) TaxID=936435 RepID=F8QCM4_SERL3|nr:hypothetical protein SERLA73DRAFT_115336 [Serpula lacrymans var. lacrymans S7.3]
MGGGLWEQAREALAGVADLAAQHGSKGIDLFFLHSSGYNPNLKTRRDIEGLFNSVAPEEDTPTASKLDEIINFYLPFVERKNIQQEPIRIVVITDGAAKDFPRSIVEAAQRLERAQVAGNMFNIVFVQIGDDEEARVALHELDVHLAEAYQIRDMVGTIPFDPNRGTFDAYFMVKILIGEENAP